MDVKIDETKCIGAGMCEAAAPTLFEIGDEGVTTLLRPVEEADAPRARRAVRACPANALEWVE